MLWCPAYPLCADKDIITTCEYLPYYSCYSLSECGNFGAGGTCGWKQTTAFTSCMAQHGM